MIFEKKNGMIAVGNVSHSYGIYYPRIEYTFVGHDNAFTPTVLNYDYFVDNNYITYMRNILRKNAGRSKFNLHIYIGSLQEDINDHLALYTEIPTNVIFGHTFNNPTHFAYADLVNHVIYTETENFNVSISNSMTPLFYENASLTTNNLVLVFNAINTQTIIPYYEKLTNPFISSSGKTFIYDYIKQQGSFNFKPSARISSQFNQSYELKLPKVMLQYRNKIYTSTDGTTLTEFTPSSTFLTLDELNQHGMSFDVYNNLPKQAFYDALNIDLYLPKAKCNLLINGYVIPTYMLPDYWFDAYQENYFIWAVEQPQHYLFIMGKI